GGHPRARGVWSMEERPRESDGGGELSPAQWPQLVEADQSGGRRSQGSAATGRRLDVSRDGRMVWVARQPQATLDAAGLSTECADQRRAAGAVVGDRRSLHGIDRDSG